MVEVVPSPLNNAVQVRRTLEPSNVRQYLALIGVLWTAVMYLSL